MPTSRILELRRQLAAEIVRSLGWGSQYVIAPSFGIPQPRMSELNHGIVDRCSVEWLIHRIHRMGGSVEISVLLGDVGRQWRVERLGRVVGAMGRQRAEGSVGVLIPDLE